MMSAAVITRSDVWMEVKLVLSPDDYHSLRVQAQQQSKNVVEFLNQLIARHLDSKLEMPQ